MVIVGKHIKTDTCTKKYYSSTRYVEIKFVFLCIYYTAINNCNMNRGFSFENQAISFTVDITKSKITLIILHTFVSQPNKEPHRIERSLHVL